jgi:hypothetical protein
MQRGGNGAAIGGNDGCSTPRLGFDLSRYSIAQALIADREPVLELGGRLSGTFEIPITFGFDAGHV